MDEISVFPSNKHLVNNSNIVQYLTISF